jgi:hypothetical protein
MTVLFLSAVAYTWHAFAEPDDPGNDYVSAVTFLEGHYNVFNEDYHVVHHQAVIGEQGGEAEPRAHGELERHSAPEKQRDQQAEAKQRIKIRIVARPANAPRRAALAKALG